MVALTQSPTGEARYRITLPDAWGRTRSVSLAAWQSGPPAGPASNVGVLFLHGIGLTHHAWVPSAQRVAAEYPSLAVTIAGHGESDPAPDGDYSLRAHAARLLAVADKARLERLVLVGNSLGGAIALAAALAEPERIAGLVLVNAAAYRLGLPWIGRLGCIPGTHRILPGVPAWGICASLAIGSGARDWVTMEHGRRCRSAFRLHGGRGFALSLRALYSAELEEMARRYPALHQPALVLRGDRDPLIPLSMAQRLAADLPYARFVPLPGLAHFPQEQNPALLAEHCLAFVRQVAAATAAP
jgi:pimeloyl-ACP methyl ester carboxylesterase